MSNTWCLSENKKCVIKAKKKEGKKRNRNYIYIFSLSICTETTYIHTHVYAKEKIPSLTDPLQLNNNQATAIKLTIPGNACILPIKMQSMQLLLSVRPIFLFLFHLLSEKLIRCFKNY